MPVTEDALTRVKRGVTSRIRHKSLVRLAKGFRGRRKNVYRIAKQAVMKAHQYSYVGRKRRKRSIRSLWIIRINITSRIYGISYSSLMKHLRNIGVEINRKQLSDLIGSGSNMIRELAGPLLCSGCPGGGGFPWRIPSIVPKRGSPPLTLPQAQEFL